MVSRLFGKLEAQRQRTSGSDCAMAGAATAAAAAPAAPEMNFLRVVFMAVPFVSWIAANYEERGGLSMSGNNRTSTVRCSTTVPQYRAYLRLRRERAGGALRESAG